MIRLLLYLPLLLLSVVPADCAGTGPSIAVLGPMAPASSPPAVNGSAAALRRSGYPVTILTPSQLGNATSFNARLFRLLVLPDSTVFPAAAQPNVLQFLRSRGKLIAVGGPAFSRYVYQYQGKWQSRASVLSSLPDAAPLLTLEGARPQTWPTSADTGPGAVNSAVEPSPHGPALHLTFPNFKNWANIAVPGYSRSPFPPGDDLTAFWARGDAHTPALVLEWQETDHSRWIASVPLTTDWKRFVLSPSQFRFWRDGSPPDRGGPGDRFHPERAHTLLIGLAQSHAGMPQGPKQFWIADVAAAHDPGGMLEIAPPVLESLSPWYKIYTHGGVVHPILRSRGIGLTGPRTGVLNMQPDDVSWSFASLAPPYSGAVWGGCESFRPNPVWNKSLIALVDRMLNGIYLPAAGTDRFSYWPGEPITAGADIANLGDQPRSIRLEFRESGSPQLAAIKSTALTLAPGESQSVRFQLPSAQSGRPLLVEAMQGQEVLASAEQPVRVIPLPTAPRSRMVQVSGGEFLLNGRDWRPVGINFWPLYVSGQDVDAYHAGWLAPNSYDPELVERDLAQCQALKINEVSIQYDRPDWAPALNDFLVRCRAHGIRANIFVPGANALAQDLKQTVSLIQSARLAGNDAVFAYDIAWEPTVGGHEARRRLDAVWLQWITDQYGSLSAAQAEWAYPLPIEDNKPTNPLDGELTNDGPWRRMVSAYRRFMDDEISAGYARSAAVIRAVDPDHLIGVRSGYGGNGGSYGNAVMAYDLLSGAKHLDFISPEGYAVHGPWNEFRGGGLTTAYARWAGNGKPVFWAEYGQSVYPNTTVERLEEQRQYYESMMRMVIDSGANGASGWWYPGGLRIDENSDFGIIDPGGAPRPAALELRKHGPAIAAMTAQPGYNSTIRIDRDADARGYAAIWSADQDPYVTLRGAGKRVGIITAGTGTTTDSMPLTAVGDVPASGHDPLMFANAEFNSVRTTLNGSQLGLTVSVGNTGEAEWLAKGTGRVVLLARVDGQAPIEIELPHRVLRYQDVSPDRFDFNVRSGSTVTLRMAIVDRHDVAPRETTALPFGELYRIPAASLSGAG